MDDATTVVDRFDLRRLFAVRRLLVLSGVIIGLVAPSAASATITQVFGTVACATQESGATAGQRWCGNSAGSDVPSWDGTPIDVAVGFPVASGSDNNYPVIGLYHGWGGSKITPSSATAQRWLKLGYAVVSMSDRGWGDSCGAAWAKKFPAECEHGYVHLMSRRYEVHDAQYMLGLLADEGVINPQRIGANGGSYGGGMSLQLGSLRNRVELTTGELIPWVSPKGTPLKIAATAPEYPWTDLAQSLQPNGSNLDYVANAPYSGMLGNHEFGIEKRNWNEALYLAGLFLDGAYYAPAPAEPEANLTEWYNFNATGGPYNGKPLALQQEEVLPFHSPYYTNLSVEPAPTLMENGWNDDLFPVDQTVDYYNKVRATYPNAATKLFYWDLGHNPRSTTTPSTAEFEKFAAAQNAWFEYYVKGEGSEPEGAHGSVTAFTSVCPAEAKSSGQEFKVANWASLAPGELRMEGAAEQTIQAPGTSPKTAFASGNVCSTESAGENSSAATYKLAPAPSEGFTIAGSTTVIGEFSTPSANDQVIARLYDVNEPLTGAQQVVGRAIYRPINPGGGFTKQVFQLHPQAWTVTAGRVLKLELLVQDSTYARSSSSPQPIQVKNLEVRVPTSEPPGSDGGLVKTPLPKYLPPGYTLARNVATTVPGVPHVSSGGNPNTGVFTLAWEPSEAAAALTYTLQHKPASGGSWSNVATGLTSAEYAFTAGSREEEGVWIYRVSASNEGAESEFSGASGEVKVDRSPPVVVTEPASSVTQTSATLNATVNPKDQTVSNCHFEYGTTMSYGLSVPCSSPPGSGESPVAVSAVLSLGTLSENTTYHFRIVATNVNGTSMGSDVQFTTPPNQPAVVTGMASSITQSSATLNATVDPEGGLVSDCHFEYGTSEAYGSNAPCSSLPGSGESPVAVSASIGSLSASTTYHFRIVATNPSGTSYGSDATFATLATTGTPHWYHNTAKIVQGGQVPTVSWGTLTLTAEAPSTAGPSTCEDATGGIVENPVGGGAGVGQTRSFISYNCANAGCPAGLVEYPLSSGKFVEKEFAVLAGPEVPGVDSPATATYAGGSLPWPSVLSEAEAGKVRNESKGVVVVLACVAAKTAGAHEGERQYLGAPTVCSTTATNLLAPLDEKGTNFGPNQSKLVFDKGSGKLLCKGPGPKEGEEVTFEARTTGSLKVMGYKGSELIFAK